MVLANDTEVLKAQLTLGLFPLEETMSIYELTAIKTKTGAVFSCPTCKIPAMDAIGANDKAELRHLLICPGCHKTLGEWSTIAERQNELSAFAAKIPR
jgi:hypothetical protein